MIEPRSVSPAPEPAMSLPGRGWSDLRWLVLLLLLTAGIRTWQIVNTELTSRDSISYIRAAWRLDHEPWTQVLRTENHHPGYGLAIWLLSGPVRAVIPDNLPQAMQLSAQLTSALASLLLVFPLFYLGKGFFDARVAFWATLLFQVLPSSGRLMPDGVSEPLYLLWVALALWCALRGLDGGRTGWFVLTGLFSGLAYLTRTEGLIVAPATLFVLAVGQFLPQWRRSWRAAGTAGGALTAACCAVAVPFMILIGGVSLKASARDLIDGDGWRLPPRMAEPPRANAVVAPLPLADWRIGPEIRPADRLGWATKTLAVMFDKGLFHILTLPALVGMWLYRRRPLIVPGLAVLVVCAAVLIPLLWRLAYSAGYLSERHLLVVVLAGTYFAVACVGAVAARMKERGERVALVVLLLLVVACLPRTLGRLHRNRTGFREAGEWIARNTLPGDNVFDPLAWGSYHAGRLFVPPDAPRSQPRVCYVIWEQSRNEHPHLYYLMDLAKALIRQGEVVHRVTARRGRSTAEILVYRTVEPPATDLVGFQLRTWLAVNHRR